MPGQCLACPLSRPLLSPEFPVVNEASSFGSCLVLLVGIFGVKVLFGVALRESFGDAPRVKSLAGLSDGNLPGLGEALFNCLDNKALAPNNGVFLEALGISLAASPSFPDITSQDFSVRRLSYSICSPTSQDVEAN